MILSVEDLQGTATVLVPLKAQEEVKKRAPQSFARPSSLFGSNKTKTNLFLAEDIIFPEIGKKPQQRAHEPVYAVLTSDFTLAAINLKKKRSDDLYYG